MFQKQLTRREVLKGTVVGLAVTTFSWPPIKSALAAREKKIVYWHLPNFTPLADELQKEQVFAFAKLAGVKESEVDFITVGGGDFAAKIAAALEAGNPPDSCRLYESNVQFYRAGGHLLEVTDIVEKMKKEPKGIFEASIDAVSHEGKAYGVPLAINPWPVHARMDLLEEKGLEYPKTWDEFVETAKKIQKKPRLYALGMCLGLVEDTTDNVMNVLWCFGGKMVEKDNKTVVMHSKENVAGVKFIEDMFKKHEIIPRGTISWDNSGNNKAYQSEQVAFVMNPTSIYAYLYTKLPDLEKVTALMPVPAGPAGSINQIDTWSYGVFKQTPYPELAKGLVDYFMQPDNYNKIIESTGGRWVPIYKRLFETEFWRSQPKFKHFIQMAETGVPVSYAGTPTPAAGEVLNTHVIPKMIQRVLVENWEAEKALEECHNTIAEIYKRYNNQG
jgi:multiple sugar transport system substrate-binding protein